MVPSRQCPRETLRAGWHCREQLSLPYNFTGSNTHVEWEGTHWKASSSLVTESELERRSPSFSLGTPPLWVAWALTSYL